MPALIISTTPVKPERIPEPLWVEIIFPTLNNLKILNQAELTLSPNAMDINSGTTETISIKPFMLKTYDNLLFEQNRKLKVELLAPTGKAAARIKDSIQSAKESKNCR